MLGSHPARHRIDPMNFVLKPWQLCSIILAGWVNQQQQLIIDYLRTENEILKENLGQRRILLDDDQRRRLAVKGKVLGRKLLAQVGTLFTPDTTLCWHRLLIAQKWDYSQRRRSHPGRPRVAPENPGWGYDRITRGTRQPGSCDLGHHGAKHSERARSGTRTAAALADDVEGLSQVSLRPPGGDRLHDRRGLVGQRSGDVLPAGGHGSRHASRALRWPDPVSCSADA
jgi:hypothetical protein